jgi:PIN domain nuclease of toxin-antitoxin system
MKYLIDTHIFLWSLFMPEKIDPYAAKIIQTADNRVFVSVVTFWEIALKFGLNKLKLEGVTPDELPELASKIGFEILDLKPDDAASFYCLPRLAHKDPFDRMIIWQAIREKMVMVSKDSKVAAYQQFGLKTLSIK